MPPCIRAVLMHSKMTSKEPLLPKEFVDISGMVIGNTFVGHRAFGLMHITKTLPHMSDAEIAYALIGSMASDDMEAQHLLDFADDYFPARSDSIVAHIERYLAEVHADGNISHPTLGVRYSASAMIMYKANLWHSKNTKNALNRGPRIFSSVSGMTVNGVFVGHGGYRKSDIINLDYRSASLVMIGSLSHKSAEEIIDEVGSLWPGYALDNIRRNIECFMLDIARHGSLCLSSNSEKMTPVSDQIQARANGWYIDQPDAGVAHNHKTYGAFSVVERLVIRNQFVGCTVVTKGQISQLQSDEDKAFAITGLIAEKTPSEALFLADSFSGTVKKLVERNIIEIYTNAKIKVPWSEEKANPTDEIILMCKAWKRVQEESKAKSETMSKAKSEIMSKAKSEIMSEPTKKDLDFVPKTRFNRDLKSLVKGDVFVGHFGVNAVDLPGFNVNDKALIIAGALTHCSVVTLQDGIPQWVPYEAKMFLMHFWKNALK